MPIHFYNIPPIPADPKHTRYLDAGVLRFGIEHRSQLRERLPELLVMAAGEHLVSDLDSDLISKRVDELTALVDEAREALAAR